MAERDRYQAAMKDAASAAWDRDWPRAVGGYEEALKAVPGDPQALAGLALALFESGANERARDAYTRLAGLVPSDPLPREKLGAIHRRLGDSVNAAKQYAAAGEIYYARKDSKRAVRNWEQAVRLDLDQAQAHMRLALAYEAMPHRQSDAIVEYLHVARLLQGAAQAQRAEQALKRALSLDPLNPDIRNALDDLRRGRPLQAPEDYPEQPPEAAGAGGDAPPSSEEEALLQATQEDRPRTPVEESIRYAMGLLADSIWTSSVPPGAQAPLLAALDAHQLSDTDAALENYARAQNAGFYHPALHFNMGVLAYYQRQFAAAVNILLDAVAHEDYELAGNLLLGQANFALGEPLKAAQHLLVALRAADRRLNPGPVDEEGYQQAIANLPAQNPGYMTDVAKAITYYIDDAGWRPRLLKALSNYAEQGKISYVPDLLELMIEGGQPELAAMMERVDGYLQHNQLHMATEELHYVIDRLPDYLPAHRRLADTLVREGRTQEAASKINLVASVYQLRGNAAKAADLFGEVIDLWPADMGARRRVIDMLRQQGRSAEVMRHYVEMADTYYRLMADPDKAVEVYQEALAYSREAGVEPALIIPVLRGLADIESQRLNWRRALQYYERITELVPEDEGAALMVVDLHYQLGEAREAVWALDETIRLCIKAGKMRRVTEILEDQVQRRPQEIPLRQRLAEVYRQQGRTQDAITQFDALGELQLDAGQVDEAIATIQRIVDMNPPDIEGYRKLLAQLKSGSY